MRSEQVRTQRAVSTVLPVADRTLELERFAIRRWSFVIVYKGVVSVDFGFARKGRVAQLAKYAARGVGRMTLRCAADERNVHCWLQIMCESAHFGSCH